MRIAVVNGTKQRVGGAETYLGRVIPALQHYGHELFFFHEQQQALEHDIIPGLADVRSTCASEVGTAAALGALAAWQPDVLYMHGLDDPRNEAALLDMAPAVFFAHTYYGTCISGAKAVRIPQILPCGREFGAACLLHYYPRRCGGLNPLTMVAEYRRQLARLGNLRRCHTIVTLSEHMRREYLRHGFADDRVHRLPPVDAMEPGSDAPGRPEGTVAIVDRSIEPTWRLSFIGRMHRLKGCQLLIRALPAIRSALTGRLVLTIAGSGPDMERCQETAWKVSASLRDTDIIFRGWLPHAACAELLETSDVLVVPSLWPEPFGLVGLEAIRRGVPVTAFAVGGIPEWLDDGQTGTLAPADPPTSKGLAAAVVRCLTSPTIRQTVRDRACHGASERSIQEHAGALMPLLAAAAGSRTIQGIRAPRGFRHDTDAHLA